MVVLTRSVIEAPAASRMAARFRRACSVWASIPSGMDPDSGSIPAVPEQKTKPPATMAWLYGPSAAGACSVETACRFMSLSLPFPVMTFSAGRYSHVPPKPSLPAGLRDCDSVQASRPAQPLVVGRCPPVRESKT
jgi:hypothetical protein